LLSLTLIRKSNWGLCSSLFPKGYIRFANARAEEGTFHANPEEISQKISEKLNMAKDKEEAC
jgi:hypothetical protein